MTAKPTPTNDWSCPVCHTTLGYVTKGGDLVITSLATVVERSRLAVVIRCTCGNAKAFSGRRVVIDVPGGPVTKAA